MIFIQEYTSYLSIILRCSYSVFANKFAQLEHALILGGCIYPCNTVTCMTIWGKHAVSVFVDPLLGMHAYYSSVQ